MMIYYLCYIIWTYKKAPGAKTYISTRWSDITKMIEGDLRNPKMHTFIFTIIFTFHVFHDFESIPQDLRVPLTNESYIRCAFDIRKRLCRSEDYLFSFDLWSLSH